MKYIIDVPDNDEIVVPIYDDEGNYMRVVTVGKSCIPYTEPDHMDLERFQTIGRAFLKWLGSDEGNKLQTKEEVYKFLDRNCYNKDAVENEVWMFARNLLNYTDDEWGAIERMLLIDKCTYQEAKAKYEAWKKEKEKLRVGDEVIYHRNKYIVGYVGEDEVYHLVDQCWIRVVVQGDYQLTKTGRHFPEVTELLKKMRGEE